MNATGKIRRLRIEKGYSQQYMAHKLCISQNAYCKLERGDTQLSLGKLEQLASVLETSIEEILDRGKDSGPNKDTRMENLEKEVIFLKSVLKELLSGGG